MASAQTERKFTYIGQPMPVIEDRRFVRGRGRYINDLELPGMLHVAIVPAPVAHARLTSVDVSGALKRPGVVTAFAGAEIQRWMKPIPQEFINLPDVHWYPLVIDKIRVAGEWIAAVVGTSRAAAEDAAEAVDFQYEELPPVVDPEEALRPGAAVLHESMGSNLAAHESQTFGDVAGAFARADHVFEYRYRWHRHSGVPLETFGCVAAPRPDGSLDIWASQQNPGIQQEMMNNLDLPSARVHMDIDIGGSYGSKRGKKQMYIAAVAALMTEHPVKFMEDRVENLVSGDNHGSDRVYYTRVAVSNDGILQALDIYAIEDVGAYGGRAGIRKPITALNGPYRIPNIRYGGDLVFTCKTNQVPFRGNGQAPHNFMLERTMDLLARDLGIDRIELRLKNYIRKDEFPYATPSGSVYDSGDYETAMNRLLEESNLAELRDEQAKARAQGRLVGIGIAGCLEPSGTPTGGPEGARIEIDQRGRVVATIGFQSAGQSHETMVTQIVCDELGVDPSNVLVERQSGMGGIVGGATTGSRMTLMLGGALHQTAAKVRAKLRRLAAHAFEVDESDIVVDGSRYSVAGDPARSKGLKELAALAYPRREAGQALPYGMEPGLVEHSVYGGPKMDAGERFFPSYAFDFHLVMVEIDPATYALQFRRYVVVHDCGTIINPLVVEGFVFGGIGHGVGGALYEHFAYDENGMLVTASFMDYLIPTASEVPHVELHTMETPSPVHPFGAKGTAEGSYMTAPAAIASAVEDALAPFNARIVEVPITPVMLHQLITLA
ncbi:MAG: xanthine dehydrogenase family protein molybdopterin-binding subunit [Chloroflexi bacterium]|nr:xanthine dehydrogenase family protein molybdopterin-binding subunit [Chloroflexota bacterium]